ncbi:hypothetical protein L7F22_065823 [Adiantum nelumboides]|nr:hypothetical protein [Adiantum nelumboides]
MEDVAPRRRRAQRSPTPPKQKRSPHSPHRRESKREEKSSRKKKERKRSPSSPSSPPSSSSDESNGYSSQVKQRRGHRRSYAAGKKSSKLKKFKEGGKNISFLTYDGTFGATNKVLAFIQQFDAAFGNEGFREASKLRHVAMHFQKSARQWWASLQANGEVPKTWKALRASIMKQFLTSNAKDKPEPIVIAKHKESVQRLNLRSTVKKRICCLAILYAWHYDVEGARPPALYVFGDSYADTGNHDKQNPQVWQPWKIPYGSTWPGNPSGRYSDGFVLTDFIAKFLNLPSPSPYSHINEMPATGVNFAYGGSGVFFTYGPEYTNISAQIDQFEQMAKGKPVDYENSLVLFVYGGNDYSIHIQKHGVRGIPVLITRVVRQLSSLLARLHKLGFRRFAVTNLEPAGCLPFIRMPRSFGAGLLESCCVGMMKGAGCGSVDKSGKPLYKICGDSSKTFFWDGVHPTQAGWEAVSHNYNSLLDSLA